MEVLGPAAELPLPVFGEQEYPEETRLTYRFLDLRRDKLHRNIMTRSAVINSIRARMKDGGFFEFQTPILTASSPEGARDFLVPSRLHPGRFYALPQAPQQYKQLIMISGFDRYFQIAPCFRDEDPRADRLPGEFYQLDVEMSFVTQEDVWAALEPVIRGVFYEFAEGREVTPVFPRIRYADAMLKYGSDKPDLRNPLVIADVTEALRPRGRDLQRLQARHQRRRRRARDPGAGRRRAAALVLRQAQRMGARRGRRRPRLRRVRGGGRQAHRQGTDREVHSGRGAGGDRTRRAASRPATRCSSPPARRRKRHSSPARRGRVSATS